MQKLTLAALITATTLTSLVSTASTAQQAPPNEKYSKDSPCGTSLGYMRRVHPEQVTAVDLDYRVWVTPICMESKFGLMRSQGNAGKLRGAIAANDVLVDVLSRKEFTPEDVVGVRMMGDDTINLYVHPSDY